MRYVGFAALAATFWLLVATVRLIVHDDCASREVAAPRAPVPVEVIPPRASVSPRLPNFRSRSSRFRAEYECALEFEDPPSTGLAPLHRQALIAGMNAVRPEVDHCYLKYGVPGTAMAKVRIGLDGSVRSAAVTGKFAGTPTGACVEAAVKTARFVPSRGLVTSYPFQLR